MPMAFDLGEYLTGAFVETGTCYGDGVIKAMQAGFKQIHSIEISAELLQQAGPIIQNAMQAAGLSPDIKLYNGDTVNALPVICEALQNDYVTFWLDAHTHYFENQTVSVGQKPCPLIEELAIIKRFFNNNTLLPVILIDDLRCIRDSRSWGGHDVTLHSICEAVLAINPDYSFKFLNGHIPHDVLACLPPAFTKA